MKPMHYAAGVLLLAGLGGAVWYSQQPQDTDGNVSAESSANENAESEPGGTEEVPDEGAEGSGAPDPDGPARGTAAYEITQIDHAIAARERLGESQSSWLQYEHATLRLLQRAKLSGRYEDFSRAQQMMDKAFEVADEGQGPFVTRASLNYTLHRFQQVDEDLARFDGRPMLPPGYRVKIEGIHANMLVARGDYAGARTAFQTMLEAEESVANLARLGHLEWKTNNFERAESMYLRALELASREGLEPAWLELNRGLMDLERGNYEAALRHYRRADAVFPGWYLIREHIAEILVEQGKLDEAKEIYLAVVEETDSPEFMDALAGLFEAQGNAEEAASWAERARAAFEQRLVDYPEAASGHALDYFLFADDDAARVVELAERNHSQRPAGEAAVQLATAYLKAGRLGDAGEAIERVLSSEFETADSLATGSVIFELSGQAARAAQLKNQAMAINPDSEGTLAELRELAGETQAQ